MHPDYEPNGTTNDDLVLTRLPSGEHAWLRPAPECDDVVVLTDLGRRILAEIALFGKEID